MMRKLTFPLPFPYYKILSSLLNPSAAEMRIKELKHSLLCTSLELESAQLAAQEEKRRNDENIKKLLQLLKAAFQERDEAKDQLQVLLNKIFQLYHVPNLRTESPPIMATRGNSRTSDPDSLSETYHCPSFVSSPVNSFLDAVNSPELSNINMSISSNAVVPDGHFHLEYKLSSNGNSSRMTPSDPASVIIDRLVMGKPLPKKGKLLQAVTEAGPLLQTLLVAGSLPQWQNPPPLRSLHIPPISINECGDSAAFSQKQTVSSTSPTQAATQAYHQTSNGNSLLCSTSMLYFPSTANSSLVKRLPLSYGVNDGFANDPSLMGKRRKLHC